MLLEVTRDELQLFLANFVPRFNQDRLKESPNYSKMLYSANFLA
uniref:Integrase catalytic domain-containing protein n=1 Tax=Heterorhabditis bacteriophora TaxID=37862 RepID=A0A1I7X5L2_HETBA